MYTIVLTNGNIINVNAVGGEWCDKEAQIINLVNENNRIVAQINMKNVVGLIDADICRLQVRRE